jgi:hypothetical protein
VRAENADTAAAAAAVRVSNLEAGATDSGVILPEAVRHAAHEVTKVAIQHSGEPREVPVTVIHEAEEAPQQ